jgi:membrane-associated protease RseP (regulator of RpoE activity)
MELVFGGAFPMNAFLSLAGVVAPAAAVAVVAAAGGAGGVCPPEGCSGAGQTLVVRPALGNEGHLMLHAQVAGLPLAMLPQDQNQITRSELRTHIKVVQQDDTGTYELVIDNGEPSAKVNGRSVPAERIKERAGGVWVIEGENGETLATFHIGAAPAAPQMPGLARDFSRDLAAELRNLPRLEDMRPRGTFNIHTTVEQPKTMFGVVMGPAPDDASGSGILIERVIEGLPADRAGIRSGDVIIAIEGASQATPDALRALLREKAAGDEVTMTLRRDGAEQQVTVTLEAFDNQKLTGSMDPGLPRALSGAFAGSLGGLSADARRQMDEALKALGEAESLASGEAREAHEHARKAIEQFVAALERMEAEGLSTRDAMRGDLGRWFSQFKDDQMVWGDKPGMVFTLPPNSLQFDRRLDDDRRFAGGNTETERERIRKDDVETRLNAMAQRLERIEKLLEKLAGDTPQGAAPADGNDPNRQDR